MMVNGGGNGNAAAAGNSSGDRNGITAGCELGGKNSSKQSSFNSEQVRYMYISLTNKSKIMYFIIANSISFICVSRQALPLPKERPRQTASQKNSQDLIRDKNTKTDYYNVLIIYLNKYYGRFECKAESF